VTGVQTCALPICYTDFAVAANNSAIQETTGYTPNFLFLGREIKSPVMDLALSGITVNAFPTGEFKLSMQQMIKAHQQVREIYKNIDKKYEKKAASVPESKVGKFKANDQVWLFSPSIVGAESNKFSFRWTGPFKILGGVAGSKVIYKIKHVDTDLEQIVHGMRLKKYVERQDRLDPLDHDPTHLDLLMSRYLQSSR
jgi:hypothetical protein